LVTKLDPAGGIDSSQHGGMEDRGMEHGGIEPMLDHLVYGTPDLARTIAEFTASTGIAPAVGGRHLGRGSRNVLVGLSIGGRGPTAYLEIIGPDLEHPPDSGSTPPFGVADLTMPRLVTWAVHPSDPERTVSGAAAAGVDLGPLRPMSRRTAAGDVLAWRLAVAEPAPFGGVLPFVIDWGTTVHPARNPELPQATLRSLTATHPDPTALTQALQAMQVRLTVDDGPAQLVAVLDTPSGRLTLS
jgi:hypothetical protein